MQHHVGTAGRYPPAIMAYNHLGQQLKALRKESGRTQTQVGVVAEVSRQQIDHIENGRRLPTLGTLEGFAKGIGRRVHISFPREGGDVTSVDVPADLAPLLARVAALPAKHQALIALLCETLPGLPPEVVGMLEVQVGHFKAMPARKSRKII
ncbi:MAG: transcriptional regulator with XRE-family HTH domain [Myxococcota bacterium]|jgi:transcriptional regulator with XRE-family HTH domain